MFAFSGQSRGPLKADITVAHVKREVALAKWTNTVNAQAAADHAIEIHGAYGYSNEFPVERFWRNSRGAVIYEGTKEIQQIIQAEYALGYRQDGALRCELPATCPRTPRGRTGMNGGR